MQKGFKVGHVALHIWKIGYTSAEQTTGQEAGRINCMIDDLHGQRLNLPLEP